MRVATFCLKVRLSVVRAFLQENLVYAYAVWPFSFIYGDQQSFWTQGPKRRLAKVSEG